MALCLKNTNSAIDATSKPKERRPKAMSEQKYVSRLILKPDLQVMLRALRKHPAMTVTKIAGGYTVTDDLDNIALKAMIGTRAYLVRFNKGWFANI